MPIATTAFLPKINLWVSCLRFYDGWKVRFDNAESLSEEQLERLLSKLKELNAEAGRLGIDLDADFMEYTATGLDNKKEDVRG